MLNLLSSSLLSAEAGDVAGTVEGGTAAVGVGLVGEILYLVMILIEFIALIKMYRKIGVSPLVILLPIYNFYVFFKAFGVRKWFWAIVGLYAATFACALGGIAMPILYVVSFVTCFAVLVATIRFIYNMARSFGKGFGFFLGLLIATPIFYFILAFGKAEYVGAPD